ncbi:MAG: four helix bundle protein [Candidatus Cloacimonetes bacterium]|nr:four helix bundle protein [Candidatus Cloacimonadota bacterium]
MLNVKCKIVNNTEIDLKYIETNPILKKSLEFSIEIVNYCKILKYNFKEYSIADQLIRSGTSTCPVK